MREQILAIVRENPGLTAKQIRAKLGIAGTRKKEINRILYAAKSEGKIIPTTSPDSKAPTWEAVGELVS